MTAPAHDSRLMRAALAYAEQGWFVFPLEPRAKTPFRGSQGFKEATRNLQQIRGLWQRTPDANIGLWPGPSQLTVIDIDGPEGEQLAQSLGLLREPTLACHSGREGGGRHLYFRAPSFPVANAALGPKLDVRGQAGYVILPPSVHPTGRRYRWEGRVQDVCDLPPEVLSRLQASADPTLIPAERPINGSDLGEGGRNNELTRVAGNLLTKHPVAEATELLWSYNLAHCKPPLQRREVEGIVASLSKREMRKPSRLTETGKVLSMAEGPGQPTELPDPGRLSGEQVEAARTRGRLDLSGAPRWQWPDLHRLVGVMVPGDLIVVGALQANGKTSFLLSQLDWNAAQGIPTLYLPLEVDPADVRRRWAAWKLGLDYTHVARNDWHKLAEGAQEAHEETLAEQGRIKHVQFPPDRRVTLSKLAEWLHWGVETIGARAVFIDHFHRMDFGGASTNYRVQVTETIRSVKDLAREHKLSVVAAAQLNQDGDLLDRYFPPALRRLKESAGIGEEADSVVMLSRRLRQVLNAEELKLVRAGHRSEREFEEANTMVVTCRKHRLDDEARDRSIRLYVENGRVLSAAFGKRDGEPG